MKQMLAKLCQINILHCVTFTNAIPWCVMCNRWGLKGRNSSTVKVEEDFLWPSPVTTPFEVPFKISPRSNGSMGRYSQPSFARKLCFRSQPQNTPRTDISYHYGFGRISGTHCQVVAVSHSIRGMTKRKTVSWEDEHQARNRINVWKGCKCFLSTTSCWINYYLARYRWRRSRSPTRKSNDSCKTDPR